jgi:pimeloyl-ACP methyl ester carboxylesterase
MGIAREPSVSRSGRTRVLRLLSCVVATALFGTSTGCGVLYDWTFETIHGAPEDSKTVTVASTDLQVLVHGTGARHVVFIHGNAGEMVDFVPVASKLCDEDYSKLLFDRPGHGHSERGSLGEPSALVKALHELLLKEDFIDDSGSSKVVLVAHSWGGGLAQLYGFAYPDDVAGMVLLAPVAFPDERLVDFSTWAERDDIAWILYGQTIGPLINRIGSGIALDATFDPQSSSQPEFSSHRAADLYARTSELRYMGQDDERMKSALGVLDVERPSLAMPAIILVGDSDAVVGPGKHAEHAVRHFVNATLVPPLEGQGHMLPITQPGLVAKAIGDLYNCIERGVDPDPSSYHPMNDDESSAGWGVGAYFENRARDLAAAFPANVACGWGLFVGVRATEFFGTGLGWVGPTVRAGWPTPQEQERAGVWNEQDALGLVALAWRSGDRRSDLEGNMWFFFPAGEDRAHPFTFDFDLHLIGLGMRLGFDPIAFGDALAGMVGFDPAGNDLPLD